MLQRFIQLSSARHDQLKVNKEEGTKQYNFNPNYSRLSIDIIGENLWQETSHASEEETKTNLVQC